MVRNGLVFLILCAGASSGCAEVTVEDPPSMLGMGNPANNPVMNPGNNSMGGTSGLPTLPGNPSVPTQMERPNPIGMSPGSNGGTGGGSGSTPMPGVGGTGVTMPPAQPSGPPGAELLVENFDDGVANDWIADMPDGDDGVGAWSVVPAEMGSVYAQSDNSFDDDSWSVGGALTWTDIVLEARFRFTAVSNMEDATVMMAVRFASKENYYYLEYRGDGTLKLVEEFDASESELADGGFDRVIAVDEWITLRLEVRGTTLTAFIDGVMAATGTAGGTIAQGGIALGVKENSAVEFDDVRVTVP